MNNQQNETTNLENEINDLELTGAEEIKGGQTREHILLARQVGVSGGASAMGDANGNGTVTSGEPDLWRR